MWLYNQIGFWDDRGSQHVVGLDIIGVAIFGMFMPLFGPIMWGLVGFKMMIIICGLLAIVFIFGFGYYIRLTDGQFKFYQIFCFVPVLRIKASLNLVKVSTYLPKESKDLDLIYIYHEDDPWRTMGFSDWVQIDYGDKKYSIASNSNCDKLVDKIRFAMDKHKTVANKRAKKSGVKIVI